MHSLVPGVFVPVFEHCIYSIHNPRVQYQGVGSVWYSEYSSTGVDVYYDEDNYEYLVHIHCASRLPGYKCIVGL